MKEISILKILAFLSLSPLLSQAPYLGVEGRTAEKERDVGKRFISVLHELLPKVTSESSLGETLAASPSRCHQLRGTILRAHTVGFDQWLL
jgi:hypothetical protein